MGCQLGVRLPKRHLEQIGGRRVAGPRPNLQEPTVSGSPQGGYLEKLVVVSQSFGHQDCRSISVLGVGCSSEMLFSNLEFV